MTLLTVGCLMSWIFNVEWPLFGVDLNNIELFWRFTTKSNSSNRKVSNEIKWDLEFTLTQGQNRGSVFFRQILQSHRANWIQFRVFSVKSLTGDFLAIGLNEATSTFKVAFENLPTSGSGPLRHHQCDQIAMSWYSWFPVTGNSSVLFFSPRIIDH